MVRTSRLQVQSPNTIVGTRLKGQIGRRYGRVAVRARGIGTAIRLEQIIDRRNTLRSVRAAETKR